MEQKAMEQRLRSSICCCFGSDNAMGSSEDRQTPSLIRSSSTWIRSKEGKCRGLISRMGRPRRNPGGAFRYDPLSYALNFDEGPDFDEGDGEISPAECRYRNFSSRLPASPAHPPPPPPPPRAAKEIACR